MTVFESPLDEFLATQEVAKSLLVQIAKNAISIDAGVPRLIKLATACARLCYGNALSDDLSNEVHNLIAWTDHLDDPGIRRDFLEALSQVPLRAFR